MTKNEPIRHHYIPQFILRNFCEDKRLFYCDKENEIIVKKEPQEIFVTPNLYRDEINHPEDRMRIEKGFSAYECEISKIVNERFLKEKDVIINQEENESLILFFALMGFRSKRTRDQFIVKISAESDTIYNLNKKDGDLTDFWKRNLGNLVNCRSFNEVNNHPDIDKVIKVFMLRDTFGFLGKHLAIVENEKANEFVVGDAYPTVIYGILPNGIRAEMYSICPLSPEKALLIVNKGADDAPADARKIRPCFLNPPYNIDKTHIKIRTKKLSSEETGALNELIISASKSGIAFKSNKFNQ